MGTTEMGTTELNISLIFVFLFLRKRRFRQQYSSISYGGWGARIHARVVSQIVRTRDEVAFNTNIANTV